MKINKIVGLLFIFAIILTVGWFLFDSELGAGEPMDSADNFEETDDVILGTALLVINDGLASPLSFELALKSETTAFDLLKTAVEKGGVELLYSESEFGVFVEKIGERKNKDENKYWMYFVNGEMPMIAVDKHIVSPEDIVEFKFEKSNF